ncbi:hypothetical protein A3B64_03810 [candidate division WWE3 bacterium RIFCSPLOWO2_01_FULL_37_24]|uniref:DUF4239 domain-containing protein n=1 Tax=candidate division WWE3 bacterium RIFCSPHIGHO2_02_FULL_38_14 TaxID=1802620 RepID=A0A1F4V754_UNCKA|nr:MAG: hypothetical protein A2793_00050 [candidate division WWE3 bacterium RIFCSPHIGHO2_01_FULL_38_45]OGC53032.1 MAG: hypothetical protein A3D91_01845 [candidate division WWE3 bacterium RIFCSPHIGHO2_02_FULL_38_14]OGC54231.1 MAG: hypothetical protein A3B64_03810 [candidate division WWE3 bacterium RIFCSPLOWO2_01_FULL_37_24]HLB51409.1 hypothetical protein [Patescibacteria group bacterium]
MKIVIIKSTIATLIVILATLLFREAFSSEDLLADVSGLGAFVTVFGTLYGIMAAFIVFEVWGQYNKTAALVAQEAQGLERLYRLAIYFRDEKLSREIKETITAYSKLIIAGKFQKLGSGQRNKENGIVFRRIAEIIKGITFDDDHDHVVFDHVVSHYGKLSEIRTERITQSLTRLPFLLKFFLYLGSFITIFIFITMPFTNTFFNLFTAGTIGFVISMVLQLVDDLDNPFVGHWNITPEPFVRTLEHIEQDY